MSSSVTPQHNDAIAKINDFSELPADNNGASRRSFIGKMYKATHLHVHFSAAVHALHLVSHLSKYFSNKIYYSYYQGKHTLMYISKNCRKRANFNKQAETELINAITAIWTQQNQHSSVSSSAAHQPTKLHENFDFLGKLFFNIIKNEEFYREYIYLIRDTMKAQNIDHIELRLKLGSMYRYGYSKQEFLTEKDELKILYEMQQELRKKNNLSLQIIAQFSKHQAPEKAYEYFSNLLNILEQYPEYRKLVCGFDLVGEEHSSNPLQSYESVVQRLQDKMKNRVKFSVPFLFHAGETTKDAAQVQQQQQQQQSMSARCKSNIEFAMKYGGNRIAHGFYACLDAQLTEQIKQQGLVLEFCPCSMDYFGHLNEVAGSAESPTTQQQQIVQRFKQSQFKYSINADDPNKIADKDLNENFEYLAFEHQYSLAELAMCVKHGIDAALCDNEFKQYMTQKWQQNYGHLFSTK